MRYIPEEPLFATEHNAPTFPEKAELSVEFYPLTAPLGKKTGEGQFCCRMDRQFRQKNAVRMTDPDPWCAAVR